MRRALSACWLAVVMSPALSLADPSPTARAPEQTDVFVSGQDGYHTYRIPAAIVTTKGTLLVFCEGRKTSRSDTGDIDMLLKRSVDGGKTFSDAQVIWDDGPNTCGNPCPVVDENTGHIWLLMTQNPGDTSERKIVAGQGDGTRTVWVTHSTDDGRTWADPTEITKDVKRPNWTWYATGPGVGIQLKLDPHRGRLVIPCDYIDETTGLPVYSVYGPRKAPEPAHLTQLDALVCDMQDVGARFYTRIWNMARAMEATARADKEFIVFDRPNPIGLERMEGPPITFNAGLIGTVWPGEPFGVPTRHGMTVGEVLNLVNEEWAKPKAKLTVIKIPGYTRKMTFEETGYPWVMPSPNMPTIDTAMVYTGTCVFEGTNLSEGRGTTRPFELIGAPFVDGPALVKRLNASGLKGVRFRPAWFTPTFDDHEKQRCSGVQLHVMDRASFEPVRTGLTLLKIICDMYPEDVVITSFASRLTGIPDLDKTIRTASVDDLVESWQGNLEAFAANRRPHLLYR